MNLWEKNVQHLQYVFKYLKERILCIVLIILFFIGISYAIVHNATIITPQEDKYESQQLIIAGISLDNWSTLIGTLGLGFTAIWSMFQYSKNKASQQQEKSAEIAKEFAKDIIEKLSIISEVLMSDENLRKTLVKIDKYKISRFDILELKEIFGSPKAVASAMETYKNAIFSDKSQKKFEKILSDFYGESESGRFHEKFWLFLETTLNELEYLCMDISSNAAGSQYIYPSLHQTFLDAVHILYVHISRNNKDNVDTYFINITAVYRMWNEQKKEDLDAKNNCNAEIEKLEKKSNTKIKKLLSKKPKTI